MIEPENLSYESVLANKFGNDTPAFDRSATGKSVNGERHDRPGEEGRADDIRDYDYTFTFLGIHPDLDAPEPEDHMREDHGWRPEAHQSDAGKIYTRAEIDALYPNGYVPGVASIHKTEERSYRVPEARPRRICG